MPPRRTDARWVREPWAGGHGRHVSLPLHAMSAGEGSHGPGARWGRAGIGLPNSVPGCPGSMVVEWARAAEERRFGSLATIDRIAYPTHDPMACLAAAAAVTERIGVVANVIVGPTRTPALLAKECATLQGVAGGRFVLGVGAGDRRDDFMLAGTAFSTRGRALDALVDALRAAWAGEPPPGTEQPIVPVPVEVPLLLGGHAPRSIARVVGAGSGWTVGGLDPEEAAPLVRTLGRRWREAGRQGDPFVVALAYVALGSDDVVEAGAAALLDYYRCYGTQSVEEEIVAGLLTTPEAVRARLDAFGEAGVDHVVFFPTLAALSQVHRLADALGL